MSTPGVALELSLYTEAKVLDSQGHLSSELPYDPNGNEGWQLTSKILNRRLGPESHNNAQYIGYRAGARLPGFQEEFPLDQWTDTTGAVIDINIVLRGIVLETGSICNWMAVQYALIGRYSENYQIAFIQILGGLSHPDIAIFRNQDSFFDPTQGKPSNLSAAKVDRIIRYLRQIA